MDINSVSPQPRDKKLITSAGLYFLPAVFTVGNLIYAFATFNTNQGSRSTVAFFFFSLLGPIAVIIAAFGIWIGLGILKHDRSRLNLAVVISTLIGLFGAFWFLVFTLGIFLPRSGIGDLFPEGSDFWIFYLALALLTSQLLAARYMYRIVKPRP